MNSEHIKEKTILLVDDVVTTGSVINVCKEKLEQAGASKVVCLTIGRTVSSDRKRYEDFPIRPLCEYSNTHIFNIENMLLKALEKNNSLAKEWYKEGSVEGYII